MATSIAEFILQHCKNQSTSLENADLSKALASTSLEELDNTLECLNVDEYAAAITYLLCAKGKRLPKLHIQDDDDDMDMRVDHLDAPDQSQHVAFLLQVSAFLSNLRLLPFENREATKLRDLVKIAVHVGIACNQTIRLVYPLREVILRWQASKFEAPSITHANKYALTSLHGYFALACLHAKCYHAALAILDQPVFEVATPSAVRSIHVLEYFYYGGMIYTGLKQFRDAAAFFSMALTTPAHVLSAVVVESYKKYILVSLLADGEVSPLPKSTPLVVSRNIESHVAPYLAFATAFKNLDLHQALDAAKDIPSDVGLVKQCVEALKKKRVQQLTLTYTNVSLAKIAQEMGGSSVQAESCVLDMIEGGVVSAAIDKEKDMVSFTFASMDDSAHDDALLQATIEATIMYTTRLQEIDVALTKNPKYISRVKEKRGGKYVDTDESTWLAAQTSG
ncbi:hypothetical protein LEN26_020836 [Aphanomyces euteiches]|nr:hypothetical protein LEN26_020836 [Aphanomyces euteiches]KAH9112923.1 hypothetical protein AeMF1_012808 [Aphanomyces euteiches]KAH9192708.1 hypothetical protein AeNC1_005320 [Aphanomyces euteiches]